MAALPAAQVSTNCYRALGGRPSAEVARKTDVLSGGSTVGQLSFFETLEREEQPLTASTRTIILIGLTVQALRLSAAYILMDASEVIWTRQVMALVGAMSAITLSGGTGLLVFQKRRDPLAYAGVLILVGIATLLMTAAHLSLMHDVSMPEALAPTFLSARVPSVIIALASALGIDLVIVFLARSTTSTTPESAEQVEEEVAAELARLRRPTSVQAEDAPPSEKEDAVQVLRCRHCKSWETRKPTLKQARQALRGHLAHCRARTGQESA